uniref:Lipoxygenase n=1 Tax=Ricciocarpos natans TaxID=53035 RepID=M4ZI08_RICNA|nr:lipoxygenase [Ricciocarpos natans]
MQAVGVQGAVSALQAVTAGASTESKRVSALSVGVKSSAYHGTAIGDPSVSVGKSKRSAKSSRGSNQARASLTENPLGSVAPLKLGTDADTVEIKGRIVLSRKNLLDLVNIGARIIDDQFDAIFNQLVVLQLVSVDATSAGQPKLSTKSVIEKWVTSTNITEKIIAGQESYAVTFHVPSNFGEIGAFVIRNNHPNEFYLHSVTLESVSGAKYEFPCNSWVYNDSIYKDDRVFFTNKNYLPGQTPSGLKLFRERELVALRGDGKGERAVSDRVYDYAIYNDLGSPNKLVKRPPLGGSKELPYPRRCRTGRAKSLADPLSEVNGSGSYYVPCDEYFSRDKNSGFLAGALKGIAHAVVPAISGLFDTTPNTWDDLDEIFALYADGLDLGQNLSNTQDPKEKAQLVFLDTVFKAQGDDKSVLKYPRPQVVKRNETAWMDDEEYGRQTLAGINPCVIQAVKEFPPKSSLDPKQWGPATALTEKDILPYLEGLSVQEAIKAKRLFIIDYRDMFMPYLERINKTSAKAYAPRSYFFWTSKGTMKPVAIELSLPPTSTKAASNRVFTPPMRKEDKNYYWELAKVHAATIDFGYHELVTHWVRSHAVMEPFVISTHRNLSKLHPVHTLLLPLYKNTMKINSTARQALINANGIIELTFSPGQYSMEMSSKIYGALWRFDQEALPANLIARGMAEPADASQPGGVKLVVDDYPFAKDGLEMWDAIYSYMGKYLNIVYNGSDKAVQDDAELQAWWKEAVEVGHGDKKDAPWWPKANSIKNLTDICATIAWIAGPHHAAVNFGQYAYAGFMPNRPSCCKKLIPEKGSSDETKMLEAPEKWLMNTISTQIATTIVMTVIELLSTHAVDEEYQGKRLNDNWTSHPEIKAAFSEFSAKMEALQRKLEQRNADPKLLNRSGPANVPYTLLYPYSETSGLTGKGVPYSVSI